jgi:hypothetical protein
MYENSKRRKIYFRGLKKACPSELGWWEHFQNIKVHNGKVIVVGKVRE